MSELYRQKHGFAESSVIWNMAVWYVLGSPGHDGGTAGGAPVPVPLTEGTGGMKRGRYVWF